MSSSAPEVTLLGLCDGQLDPKRHQSSYLTNKVGGQPDWLPGISRQAPRCRHCGHPLVHVVQVYCPLDTSPYHRNLHLFACSGTDCSGRPECWAVLRSQCLDAEVAAAARTSSRPAPAQEASLSATDWCDAAEDWGIEEEEEEDGWGGRMKKNNQDQEEAAASEAEGGIDHSAGGGTESKFGEKYSIISGPSNKVQSCWLLLIQKYVIKGADILTSSTSCWLPSSLLLIKV